MTISTAASPAQARDEIVALIDRRINEYEKMKKTKLTEPAKTAAIYELGLIRQAILLMEYRTVKHRNGS